MGVSMSDLMACKELHTYDSVFPLFEQYMQDCMFVINETCGTRQRMIMGHARKQI